jgi:hypothetical protein
VLTHRTPAPQLDVQLSAGAVELGGGGRDLLLNAAFVNSQLARHALFRSPLVLRRGLLTRATGRQRALRAAGGAPGVRARDHPLARAPLFRRRC